MGVAGLSSIPVGSVWPVRFIFRIIMKCKWKRVKILSELHSNPPFKGKVILFKMTYQKKRKKERKKTWYVMSWLCQWYVVPASF